MIYGQEKINHMARSATRGHKISHFKNTRSNRRKVRMILGDILHRDDCFEYALNTELILPSLYQDRFRSYSWPRSFIHWSERKAKDIPQFEKVGYIKGIISGNGKNFDIARDRLRWVSAFDNRPIKFFVCSDSRPSLTLRDISELLRKITEDPWAHRKLNELIKEYCTPVFWYIKKEIEKIDTDGQSYIETVYESVRKYPKITVLFNSSCIPGFINYYKKPTTEYMGGDEFHYNVQKYSIYRNCYSQKSLVNPDHHPNLLYLIKLFIELYKDHPCDRRSFQDLIMLGNNHHYDYYGYDKTFLRYKWKW